MNDSRDIEDLDIDSSSAPDVAVYYDEPDLIGTGSRLLIEIVDIVVVLVLVFLAAAVLVTAFALTVPVEQIDRVGIWFELSLWMLMFAVLFSYFVLLKRVACTVGYLLLGARLVTLDGKRPGMWCLSKRFCFSVFGPANLLLDALWIPTDPHRQTLHDKFARTYVVAKSAQPAGRGRVQWAQHHLLGMVFAFPEVPRPAVRTAPRE